MKILVSNKVVRAATEEAAYLSGGNENPST